MAGCPPRRGEQIPKLLRVPSAAAPLAQGWDQQPQIKVYFFCFTRSPILMRDPHNESSGLANTKNQVSQSKCTAAATTCCPHPAMPGRAQGALPRRPRSLHPHPSPPTMTRLHITPEVRHPNRKDCCQWLGYRLATRIKSFARSHTFLCFNSLCRPLPSPNTRL